MSTPTTTTTAAGKTNPNWIKTIISSLLLAILLRTGLGVPVLTTFITLGIIFVMHVVQTQIGTGIATMWGWFKSAGRVVTGVVIFLAIRFLAAKVLGLYPVDTYSSVNESGGLYGILPSRDIKTVILWELMFAFVAGQITVMWVNGSHKIWVRAIIIFSFIILTLQIGFPTYASTWPSREVVSTNLVDHGILGTSWKATRTLLFGKPSAPTPPPTASETMQPVEALALAYEGVTPCSTFIDYRFKIRTDGNPLRIKFKGVDEWFDHPAQGDVKAPTGIDIGETMFVSPDPLRPNVRVQVYKKITVREGGR